MVRLTPIGDFMSPDNENTDSQQWNVDVISPQWRDGLLASCSDTWQVFPDVGGPPAWLNTPVNLQDMLTTRSYYYLAGSLIASGQVNAGDCPDGGLISPQVANQCGLEKALPLVVDWQNRFDTEILKVSKDTGVPAQLLKNVFGRESQFWPGLYKDINEAGLGQLTEKGADTVLLWNVPFFQQFCPQVLSADTCANGFVFLKPEEQDHAARRADDTGECGLPHLPGGHRPDPGRVQRARLCRVAAGQLQPDRAHRDQRHRQGPRADHLLRRSVEVHPGQLQCRARLPVERAVRQL